MRIACTERERGEVREWVWIGKDNKKSEMKFLCIEKEIYLLEKSGQRGFVTTVAVEWPLWALKVRPDP